MLCQEEAPSSHHVLGGWSKQKEQMTQRDVFITKISANKDQMRGECYLRVKLRWKTQPAELTPENGRAIGILGFLMPALSGGSPCRRGGNGGRTRMTSGACRRG